MRLDKICISRSATKVSAIILVLFLSVTTCNATPHKPATHTVTFACFPLAVPVSVLSETLRHDRILERNLKQQGIKIVFQPFARGNETMALIRNNSIDAVAFGDMPTIEATVTGKMQIIGLAKHGYSSIIGPKGAQMRDLRHKRVGNATASTGHYALLQALNSAGIHENDVTIVPMNLNEMQSALVDGKIDAFAAWEPVPTATLQAHPNSYGVLHRQVSLVYFLLSQQLIETRPEAAKEVSAALVRAIRWLRKNNSNLAKASEWAQNGITAYAGKPADISIEEISRITRNELLDMPRIPQLPLNESNKNSLLSKEFAFMKHLNKLPATASWQQVNQSIHRELMEEILKKPARYEINRFDYAP
jgi:ABC-type nitrate/sulfonate/bicarbonate transport system substrate-binding protein